MEQLKKAILLAAKIREDSWDKNREQYGKSMRQASDEAAEKMGFDLQATTPVFLLLSCSWNDALDWAKEKEGEITHRDAQKAFEDAIKAGVLSSYPFAKNYAGDYMYMHTQDGKDAFKHKQTRKHVWN